MAAKTSSVGEFLCGLMEDRERAWDALQRESMAAAKYLARRWRLQPADVEDVGTAVLLRAAADEFALLARADPSVVLAAWLTGVARNVLLERSREFRPTESAELVEDERSEPNGEEDDASSLRASPPKLRLRFEDLPPAQATVMRLFAAGRSERAAAAELGWSRDRVRGAKLRAVKRLRSSRKWVAPAAPEDWEAPEAWAARYANHPRPGDDGFTLDVLRLHAMGVERREIAEMTGLTPKAVKELIAKRRRWSLGARRG